MKKLNLLSWFNFYFRKKINKQKIFIPFVNGLGLTNYILKEDWLDSLIAEFVSADSNEGFVDVGANIGQTLLKLRLKSRASYLGFEPNATCNSYIQRFIEKNKFIDCKIQNCALAKETGSLFLNKRTIDDPGASIIDTLRPNFYSDTEVIFSIDYDSFFLDNKISFVKIDVEGAELEVVEGMKQSIKKYRPVIVCEILDSYSDTVLEFTQKRATQLVELLKSLNYSIIQLITDSKTNKLKSFKIIEEVTIKQWTPESYELNDYLFYLRDTEEFVIEKLNLITANKS